MKLLRVRKFIYFGDVFFNVNKLDAVVYFSELIAHLVLICFQVRMLRISEKTGENLE